MSLLTRSLALVGLATLAALPVHAVDVTVTNNATTLANAILGPGITLVGTPTYTGGAGASGTFTGGGNPFGIASGIVLTTGDALIAEDAANTQTNAGATTGAAADGQLTALVGGTGFDAAVLKFDFTSASGDLFFNFVFASEEYNEYVGSQYNDVFAFFVDGVNIALVPSTTTPIAINTVNSGSNSAFYNNNSPGPFATEYDGFTTVFTVSALGLSAGQHTIKLAIQDMGDSVLDSAVFIQGGSFSSTPTPTGVPDAASSLLLSVMGLAGLVGFKRFASRRVAA